MQREAGVLARLLAVSPGALALVTLPLYHGPHADVYRVEVGEMARGRVQAVLGGHPVWAKLEVGRHGLLHVHVLTSAAARADLPQHARCTAVTDPVGLLAYLAKPADARACSWRDQGGRWHRPNAATLHAAATDHAAARLQGRLPRLTWTAYLPRLPRGVSGAA
ncbi:hypothetical protein GCM10010844_06930 [Deinococcus radiotolerans]|uniref:Uncharacterized protein n=1 Tax=Deinococcus radiotolerans TaxID=1309407 RepID=A0ABQ2FHH9_9DEIO|nr:hypothetical protein GCM10010844_06930 [Deinococcus radiotolerans]